MLMILLSVTILICVSALLFISERSLFALVTGLIIILSAMFYFRFNSIASGIISLQVLVVFLVSFILSLFVNTNKSFSLLGDTNIKTVISIIVLAALSFAVLLVMLNDDTGLMWTQVKPTKVVKQVVIFDGYSLYKDLIYLVALSTAALVIIIKNIKEDQQ